ncbi:gag-pol fusion poly [Labeo rohita]|uniref:Gag-pol fusion poly n=1 Tax=Labeo rohita TaxID=84645 RepID=A0A498LUZ1_LABRO|nr:gag-pol fusion poly [Labeo rohita]
MADDTPDLESLKRKRSNAQRTFTTRINRLEVSAGRLRQVELSEELAKLRDDYNKLLDANNEYVDARSQTDSTGDNSESLDAIAKREASEQKFLETEEKIMELLWSKYAGPDIDTLVAQFKSAFDRAEALGTSKVPWTQQRVESSKLDRKLHELKEAVYTWRDNRPLGRDKWMLFLSLREDKEQLIDEWAYRHEDEVMRENSGEIKGNGEDAEGEDEKGDDPVSGHVITGIDSLTDAGSITFTQPTTLAIATPPVNGQPAVINPPIKGRRTVDATSSPSFMSADSASISTCVARGSTVTSHSQSRLLMFLGDQKSLLVRLEQLLPSKQWLANAPERSGHREKPGDRWREKKSFTKISASEIKRDSKQLPCAMCGDGDHGGKLFRCKIFRKASLPEKKSQVKKVKACVKCLDVHGVEGDCTSKFLCRKEECKKGDTPADHHYFLCHRVSAKKDTARRENKVEEKKGTQGPTEEQEAVFAGLGLTPHQLEAVRSACTNKATSTVCSRKSLIERSGLKEHPVLMMIVPVTTKRGDCLGALVDLASDMNYITHQAVERLGEPISLVVYGVSTMKVKVDTRRYLMKIKVWTSRGTLRLHEMICYGMEGIARVDKVVKSERLEQFFPDVKPGELARPKRIDLLISTHEGRLAPQRLQRVGDLVLWDGPLGKIVSGVHPDLFEEVKGGRRRTLLVQ